MPESTVTSEMDNNERHLCVAGNGAGIITGQIKRLFRELTRLHLHDAQALTQKIH